MYRLATKCTAKKTSRTKCKREFFTTTCVLVYSDYLYWWAPMAFCRPAWV